ncbi:cysteinyl-tRNA synthetase [Mycoplasmopsis canis]|uniref:cysteine--tRNA ligase n=1 Tax=Mycoplasmopsis canis TaxID=29555 RepID=UPI0006249EEB|nr:cysteine--tRNA ligase [Mycoplasmopsis canis]AKF41195.1 cysteinyl-tRNA synthetase [Mycoplasmopsis canis]
MLKIYVCGPTVYNYVHIGNLRPIITYDLMLKAARSLKIDFKFIHNITDIDDKIINQAMLENTSEEMIAKKYSEDYFDLLKKFNVDTVSSFEFVTQNLNEMNSLVKKMVLNEDAYVIDGNVWFNINKNKKNYGAVSGQNIDSMAYEDKTLNKKHPADFALWKKTEAGVRYDSEFGLGRPGWHTECVAMIYKHFGNEGVDIHGGGMDLTFPHHENENIQFYSVANKNLAKKWIRTGQINLNNIKMSKSLQNVILGRDFIDKYTPDHLKMAILLNGVTSIINIDENLLNNIEVIFKKIKKIFFIKELEFFQNNEMNTELFMSTMNNIYELKFSDFNKSINDLIKEINQNKDPILVNTLIKIFNTLGFDFDKFDYLKYIGIYKEWQTLVGDKNYEKADLLRAILQNEKLL